MKSGKSTTVTKKADNKLSVKSKAAEKGLSKAAKKAAKDPNMPKRPPSAFFVFMEDFRKQFKEQHPNNKLVSVVAKAGGEKWKSLSETEKTPYVVKAEKRKAEYEINIAAYNNKEAKVANEAEEEESDKSKSEVNDENDDDQSGEDDDSD